MFRIRTKIAIFFLVPTLTACQMHGGEWSEKQFVFEAKAPKTQKEAPQEKLEQTVPVKAITLGEARSRAG